MKRLVIGILAHVDAGKTTLSEALLYHSGTIRKMGRVDNKDAFLDTHELERSRGITIFSKQAVFKLENMLVTLLDTPGHVDFSAETERTLQVLDYAVLVINGADGVQGHTLTLWRLLKKYKIPVFIFINKMDQEGTDRHKLLAELKILLSDECVDFTRTDTEEFYESVAVADEKGLEYYLERGKLEAGTVSTFIYERKIYPCFFGSALHSEGVDELLSALHKYTIQKAKGEEFGARVFKITRDSQGNRLTWLKITGGCLKTKAVLKGDKVNEIRIYSGEKHRVIDKAEAGSICALTGLSDTYPGEGLGGDTGVFQPVLEPILTYQVILPEKYDAAAVLPQLRRLEEEVPELQIEWNEPLKEIQIKIMGEVQTEVLQSLILERYGLELSFGTGSIVYKETITDMAVGVGHFEPLRHYAEVHLLLEPGKTGSGLEFCGDCSEDILDKNWQRLIMTHLKEREHKGVLTGAPITDMKITLLTGRAHQKHTEGGDFRQAVYRAVRQGLMQASSLLLEPFYNFRLEVPDNMTGRAMTDIEKMSGVFSLPHKENGMTVLTGSAPAAAMQDYQKEVTAYTKGYGRLFLALKGYEPCHNTEEVIIRTAYEPERDMENTASSVFCAHGAGYIVEWDKVKNYMHVDSGIRVSSLLSGTQPDTSVQSETVRRSGIRIQSAKQNQGTKSFMGTDEVDAILARTYDANKTSTNNKSYSDKGRNGWKYKHTDTRVPEPPAVRTWEKREKKEEYLLVDGYNVIFAWEDLKELAQVSIDGARGRLMDILCNYQAITSCKLILVFDAYRVQGHDTEMLDYNNIHVVYTKEAETADQYIEKFAHKYGKKEHVTVATSDGLEQIIIRGQGCFLISARELREEIEITGNQFQEEYSRKNNKGRPAKNYLLDNLPDEALRLITNNTSDEQQGDSDEIIN